MKKRIIIALVFLNTLGILALAFVHWGWIFTDRELAARAKEFKSDLLEALDKASRVDIVEHSWHYDFGETDNPPTELPYVEYKRMRLSKVQQKEFRIVFHEMSWKPDTVFLPCGFSPHHSIEIYDREGEKDVIKVCFHCDNSSWGDTETTTPESFQPAFLKFIEPLGFQAKRDWTALAHESAGRLMTD